MIRRTVGRLVVVAGVVTRRTLVAALPVCAALMLWELAKAQRDPEPDIDISICRFGCGPVHACPVYDEDWHPPPPPPPYVVRDFRADPIDDEEILDLRSGRTQALVDRAR